jgi:hypothetical protein
MNLLMHTLGWALMLVVPLGLIWLGATSPAPSPPARPQPPPAPLDAGEWLLLPFQLVAGLAGLCWALAGLLVFLSPVLLLAWLVLR